MTLAFGVIGEKDSQGSTVSSSEGRPPAVTINNRTSLCNDSNFFANTQQITTKTTAGGIFFKIK